MLPRGVNENADFSEWGVPLAIDGHSASWRLQANDAVVIFGTSPPEMRYWGVTNYLFSRFYEDATGRNNTLGKVSRCPDPPARCVNFASVGDTMNMITSNLTATPSSKYAERCDGEGQAKHCYNVTAFDSNWAFVMSPSETVAGQVAEDLKKQGVIDEVNLLPYPGQLLKLPNETWSNEADVLALLVRVAFPSDQDLLKQYLADAKTNTQVFRVTVPNE